MCYYFKILLQDCNPIPPDKDDFGDFPSKDASCFWTCHFVFPCFWHNMLQGQESLCFCHATLFSHASDTICSKDKNVESYNLFSHVLGQKMKFTIHCYYSSVTIYCYYSLRIFAYLRGAVPYIWSKCFVCLVQDFFLRESFPLRAFLCENILAYTSYLLLYKACNF